MLELTSKCYEKYYISMNSYRILWIVSYAWANISYIYQIK